MAQQITMPKTEYEKLIKRVTALEQTVRSLIEKLTDTRDPEPAYGSEQWWKWADKKGLEAIEKGEYKEFSSAKELQTYLDSLK